MGGREAVGRCNQHDHVNNWRAGTVVSVMMDQRSVQQGTFSVQFHGLI